TDPAATNYNPAATQNDGSCTYASLTPVLGCTDPAATNYNPAATQNDGSCIYVVPNQAPVLASIGNKNVNEGALLSFSISATDVDGDALTYSVSGLPSGASFIGQTFTWTPTFSQSGVYTVTFTVNDGKGGIDSKTITITVVNVNQGPVLTISDITVAEGEKAVIAPVATDFDNDPITYTVSDSRFKQTASNRFEWATWYYDAGSYLVTVRASTPDGLFDSKQITVRVKDNKIEHPNVEVKNAVVMNLGGVVRYGQPLELYVNIANTGNTDDEDTRVTVIIPELNIYEELGIFSLDRGNKYLDIVDIDLGNNVEPGKEYYFIVRAQSDEATALKYGSFLVA
ncbi:MAG: cadherin-like domain-containing protein, partial [Nanoarchaeota archaeon]|nr:cadherin-like domain-containing protein [Nanoarchaeota archaeon]